MSDDSSAGSGGGGFFDSVNDVLGAVNNFGTTAVTLRDRWRRAPAPASGYAVPVAQGSQPGQVAAVNEAPSAPFQLSTPWVLIGGAVLLVVVVAAYKLRG